MKKGIKRIIAGIILIVLQTMSIIGNASAGIGIQLSFASATAFFYDLLFLFGYLFFGIIGLILLIWGITAYNKSKQ